MTPKAKIHLEKTVKAFSYNVIGVILPFLLSLIPIYILGKNKAIYTFLDEGQFLLFAAGLFTSTIFLYGENKSSIRSALDKVLNNLSFWLLIISSAFYAIIYCLILMKEFQFSINVGFIRITSIILFAISVLSIFRSIYVDFLKIYPNVDVKNESSRGVEDILNKL